jgi:hypothetical protein
MSLVVQSLPGAAENHWRLGPCEDPGWFDTRGPFTAGKFALATVFRLHWHLPPDPQDGIYNVLHAVTMGRINQYEKTHIEKLVQYKDQGLHVTCRVILRNGQVKRHTVALPGPWQQYQERDLLLIYLADTSPDDPQLVRTVNILFDLEQLDQLQYIEHDFHVPLLAELDFVTWPDHRVICDHEQNNVPRDHVIVHGGCPEGRDYQTPFVLRRVWGTLGQTILPEHSLQLASFLQRKVPDQPGLAQAWYNCDCDDAVTFGAETWALCGGRYQQSHRLGIKLSTAPSNLYRAHK